MRHQNECCPQHRHPHGGCDHHAHPHGYQCHPHRRHDRHCHLHGGPQHIGREAYGHRGHDYSERPDCPHLHYGPPRGMMPRRGMGHWPLGEHGAELLAAKRAYLEAKRRWLDEAIRRLDEQIEALAERSAPSDPTDECCGGEDADGQEPEIPAE